MVRYKRNRQTLREGIKVNTLIKEKTTPKASTMAKMKTIIQKSMKQKGITSVEARKSLGIKRYEK